jgi:hypothetical protein
MSQATQPSATVPPAKLRSISTKQKRQRKIPPSEFHVIRNVA